MAKGSHKTWGGWETRTCHTCGERITLHRHTAIHCHNNGHPFSLCGNHLDQYHQAKRDIELNQLYTHGPTDFTCGHYADMEPITDPDLEEP